MPGSTEADGGDADSEEVGDEPGRFVQFCVSDRDFWMDLPNTTLDPAEGNLLVRRQSGFFWVHDHPDAGNWQRTIRDFDPVNKIYLPGDVRCAAEDVAYVFFTLWKFPVDWRLYVTSFARKGPNFESDLPL
jgi:hypothetical protein